jgi:exonuclease III
VLPTTPSQAPNPPSGQRENVASPCKPQLSTHQYPPTPRDPERTNNNPTNQTLGANINIATLNMNGFAAPANHMTGIEKWSTVYRTINQHKIVILALQETHLDENLLHNIEACFGKRLTILKSQDLTNLRASARVALIINKSLIAPKELVTHEIINRWALALKIKWHKNEEAVLINFYAPNIRSEHKDFWSQIKSKCRAHNIRRPDFLMGNFNVTEDPIDRAPTHPDDPNAIEVLQNLHHSLDLQDSWRHTFPHNRCFTYCANSNASR